MIIGMTTQPHFDDDPTDSDMMIGTPVVADTALRDTWHRMVLPLGFSKRDLWVMMLQDDCLTKVLIRIDDWPQFVDRTGVDNLMTMMTRLDLPDLSAACLLIRPGAGTPTFLDRQWAKTIEICAAEAGVRVRRTHLATDEDVLTLR